MRHVPPISRTLAAAALLVSIVCTPAAAQERSGLIFGATASDLYGDFVVVRGDPTWGFLVGAFGETRISQNVALNLAVNYTQKGGRGFTGTGLLDAESVELDLNYVEMPLLVELLLPFGRTWGLMAYGGIAAGYNVTCKVKFGGGSKESCKDTALGGATFEWGLPVGGGLSYNVGDGEMIVFDVRYTWGLNDAVKDANVRNGTWQFLIRLTGSQ